MIYSTKQSHVQPIVLFSGPAQLSVACSGVGRAWEQAIMLNNCLILNFQLYRPLSEHSAPMVLCHIGGQGTYMKLRSSVKNVNNHVYCSLSGFSKNCCTMHVHVTHISRSTDLYSQYSTFNMMYYHGNRICTLENRRLCKYISTNTIQKVASFPEFCSSKIEEQNQGRPGNKLLKRCLQM